MNLPIEIRATRPFRFGGAARMAMASRRGLPARQESPQPNYPHAASRRHPAPSILSLPSEKTAPAPTAPSFRQDGGFVPKAAIITRLGAALAGNASKILGAITRQSDRAARDWQAEVSLPSTEALINLMAADDEIFHAVCELADRQPAPSLSARQKGALIEILEHLGVL